MLAASASKQLYIQHVLHTDPAQAGLPDPGTEYVQMMRGPVKREISAFYYGALCPSPAARRASQRPAVHRAH